MTTPTNPSLRAPPNLRLRSSELLRNPDDRELVFQHRFTLGYDVGLGAWAAGLPLTGRRGGTRAPLLGDPRLVFLHELAPLPESHPLRRWAAPIPPAALAFTARLQRRQLAALRLLQAAPHALDLLRDAPLLLWLAVEVAVEQAAPAEDFAEVMRWRRRDVLAWCGGVGSDAAVRLLGRLPERFDVGALQTLRRAIADPRAIELSARLSTFDPEFVGVERHGARATGLRAFTAELYPATRTIGRFRLARLLPRVRSLGEALGRDVEPALRACTNGTAVQRLHDALERELYTADPGRLTAVLAPGQRRFPRPPVPGSATIQPIRSETELVAEGRLMNHCCARYAGEIISRRSYLYRVLEPERATLELDLRSGRPRIAQLKGPADAPTSRATLRAVVAWLRASGASAAGAGAKAAATSVPSTTTC